MRPPAIGDAMPSHRKRFALRALEREPHQGDREGQQRLVPPEEPRRLEGRVEVDDRVLLLSDGPVAVRAHDRGEDLVQGDAGLEGLAEGRLRGRGFVLEGGGRGGERSGGGPRNPGSGGAGRGGGRRTSSVRPAARRARSWASTSSNAPSAAASERRSGDGATVAGSRGAISGG